MTARKSSRKTPFPSFKGKKIHPFIEMNCKGKNEGTISLLPHPEFGGAERASSLVFSPIAEMQVQAWDFVRVREQPCGEVLP